MQNLITTLFIDLDGTLYDRNNGMMQEMSQRIARYMETTMHLPSAEIPGLINRYYSTYGSTLYGIQQEHDIDTQEYLAYIHDLDLDNYLSPSPSLQALLTALPQRKWIFTNSDHNHATRVLTKLGILDQFEGILDVWSMEYIPKPHPWVYQHALEMAGDPDAEECMFIDDSLRNLPPAKQAGMATVLISNDMNTSFEHFTISKIKELPTVLAMVENERILQQIFNTIAIDQPVTI